MALTKAKLEELIQSGDISTSGISIVSYGAVPSSSAAAATNSAAVQSAINQAHENGGGTVVIPEGEVFYVIPDTIYLKTGVSLVGGSLKIPDGIGDFWTLISLTTNHTNMRISNLTVDMNDTPATNPTADISMVRGTEGSPLPGAPHSFVYGGVGSHITVEDCIITNAAGVTVILIDGYDTAEDIMIRHNHVTWVRGVGSTYGVSGWYDNTVFFIQQCSNVSILDNTFVSDYASRCNNCIEVGENNIKVERNTTTNCMHFIDITNGKGITIRDNCLNNTVNGIRLWFSLDDVLITGNKMYMNTEVFEDNNPEGYISGKLVGGVIFSTSSTEHFGNVRITDNHFVNVSATYVPAGLTALPAVIRNYGETGAFDVNAEIYGNTFKNINGVTVYLDSGLSGIFNVNIYNNVIDDPGIVSSSGFLYLNIAENDSVVNVHNNRFYYYDFVGAPSVVIIAELPGDRSNIRIINNEIYSDSADIGLCGNSLEDLFSNTKDIFGLTNQLYTNINAANMNVYTGDIVIKSDGVYRVTRFGTYGTASGITVSGTLGIYETITVDSGDITQLKTGNYFTVTGHTDKFWIINSVDYVNGVFTIPVFNGATTLSVSGITLSLVAPIETKITA